jgi:S1-C subfamily serine protease
MTMETGDLLTQWSQALAARAAAARTSVAAIRGEQGCLSAVLWQNAALVTSAQSLPKRQSYDVVASTGGSQGATLAGVDHATNIAVLRLTTPLETKPLIGRIPRTGELISAYGADYSGGVSARLGSVNTLGAPWQSSAGGQIDQWIVLDIRLGRSEEGGPIFDMNDGFVGMSTFGPRKRVLAIPAATLERVVPTLLRDGHVARGWLGMALQPVAVPEALRQANGQSAALMAMSIAPEGPAATAGLLAGDMVLSVDGHETQRVSSLMAALGPDSIGRRIEIRAIRGGVIQALMVTIEARPNA